jgi:hypothetical protein
LKRLAHFRGRRLPPLRTWIDVQQGRFDALAEAMTAGVAFSISESSLVPNRPSAPMWPKRFQFVFLRVGVIAVASSSLLCFGCGCARAREIGSRQTYLKIGGGIHAHHQH